MAPKVKLGGSGSSSPSTGSKAGQKPSSGQKERVSENEPILLTVRPQTNSTLQATSNAEISLDLCRQLDLSPGDRIVVSKPNEKGIVVRLVPYTGPPSTKIKAIHLGTQVRRLCGVLPGDKVHVVKYAKPVGSVSVVTIAPTNTESLCAIETHPADERDNLIRQSLESIGLVCPGMLLQLENHEYCISSLELELDSLSSAMNSLKLSEGPDLLFPQGVVPISSNATINIASTVVVKQELSSGYSSLGGIEKQIALLRSKIDLPLKHPDLFERFNVSPDRGFLLYGPPGTGKSKLLRAVAQESGAYILTINGPSIVSKFLGETESALRKVFEEAKECQPSIILIDEIDSLVPKRDSDDSGEAESRLVSTLLTLMDGIDPQSHVIVIGATNRINSIDPALRRPGRFGQEIEMGIPDSLGREAILRVLLSRIPHTLTDEFINEIASKSHGFVGADLDALCRDAVMLAIARTLDANAAVDDSFLQESDVRKAFVEIRPSAMREIFLETPQVFWSDIGGQELVKYKLKEAVELPLTHPETFKRLGIKPPQGILLYGPPGCSKTLIAKALATEAGLNFLAVKGPELFNKYVGESERAIREIFRKARAAAPSVIFFDEIDAISTARGSGEAGGDRVLTSLLNEMDGIEVLKDVLILAATNVPETIDAALLRPGRLDRLIYVPPPDYEARLKILEIQFKKMAIASDVDIKSLAEQTNGCSGAEMVALCQEAGLAAMNESLDIEEICARHFEASVKLLRKAITPEMIKHYTAFEQNSN